MTVLWVLMVYVAKMRHLHSTIACIHSTNYIQCRKFSWVHQRKQDKFTDLENFYTISLVNARLCRNKIHEQQRIKCACTTHTSDGFDQFAEIMFFILKYLIL